MSSLRNKTVNGVIWNALQSFGTRFIQLVITIIIARILLPSDFGIIGLLYIFIALGGVILDGGFGQALIRKQQVSERQYSSVFFFNVMVSLVIYVMLYFTSPLIASFYNEPRLIDVSRTIFLIFPINAFGIIQNALLMKSVNFKGIAKVTLLSSVVSGLFGIVLAYLDFGYWALVAQSLIASVMTVVLLWDVNKWRPQFVFDFKEIKDLLGFSLNLLGTNTLIVVFNNIYTLLIGKFYNVHEVGYYNQAKKFQDVPTSSITSVIQSVTYPVLSKIQNNDSQLREAYRKVISMAIFVNVPVMIGLMVSAENLFLILLGEKWIDTVPYFQILCIYGALFPLHSINVNILKVKDNTKMLLKLEIVRRVIMIVGIVFTLNLGIAWLLVGSVVASLFSILINMYYCGRIIDLKVWTQLRDVAPTFLIVLVCSLIAYNVQHISNNIYINLIAQISIGLVAYVLLNRVFRIKSYLETIKIIRQKIKH